MHPAAMHPAAGCATAAPWTAPRARRAPCCPPAGRWAAILLQAGRCTARMHSWWKDLACLRGCIGTIASAGWHTPCSDVRGEQGLLPAGAKWVLPLRRPRKPCPAHRCGEGRCCRGCRPLSLSLSHLRRLAGRAPPPPWPWPAQQRCGAAQALTAGPPSHPAHRPGHAHTRTHVRRVLIIGRPPCPPLPAPPSLSPPQLQARASPARIRTFV